MPIPTTNLKLSYDFSDPACYPGTGNTIFDLSGNGVNATNTNATFVDNGSRSYFDFNGYDSIIVSNSYNQTSKTVFTYNVWSQFTTTGTGYITITGAGALGPSGGGSPVIAVNEIAPDGVYRFNFGNGIAAMTTAGQINTWQMLTITADGTTVKFYINGIQVTSASQGTGQIDSGAQQTRLGGYGVGFTPGPASGYFDGRVATFQYYNTPLSAGDILTLYNDTVNRFPIYSFDFSNTLSYPGTGNTVYSLTNALDLPIVNGTAYVSDGIASYFSFDGVNDNIGLQSGITGVGNTFTINQWINPASPVTFGAAFSCGTNTGSITGPTIYTGAFGSDVSGSFNFGIGITSTPITANEWTFVTYTGDGTTNKLYKNGVLVGTASQGIGTWNSGSFLMGENAGGSARYTGKVAILDVYNVALGSTDVANVYAANSFRFDNLVRSYDFSDPLCYPGSGSTVFDLSGSELDLPIVNATYGGTGQSKYFNFTGTNQYIGKTGVTGFGSTFTINMWARQNNNNTLYHSFNGGYVNNGPAMYWNDGAAGNIAPSFNSGNNKIVASGIATSEWYLTSYVLDGTTAKLYVDGSLVGSVSQAPGISWQNGVFVLAAATDGAGNIEPAGYFVGDIATFDVYNSALGSTAISTYYNSTFSRFGVAPPPAPPSNVGGRQFAQGFNG
jgi:hypothetical protein